jgi:zeaxanthin glucosyltransferase
MGFLTFPGTGHLNPPAALGRRLRRRGHPITVFQIADVEPIVRAAGLDFVQIGQRAFPRGTLPKLDRKLSRLSGLAALHYTCRRISATSAMILSEAPSAILQAKIDALLIDQAELAGGTVAAYLSLPFISVAATLPFFAFNWRHGGSLLHKLSNRLGNVVIAGLLTTKLVEWQRLESFIFGNGRP